MAEEIGQYIPEGIAMGIEENAGVVDDAVHDMVMDATTAGTLQGSAAFDFGDAPDNSAILSRMDAMLNLMMQYVPEMADNNGQISISAINKSLGAAYS